MILVSPKVLEETNVSDTCQCYPTHTRQTPCKLRRTCAGPDTYSPIMFHEAAARSNSSYGNENARTMLGHSLVGGDQLEAKTKYEMLALA